MNAYIYDADIWCEACGEAIRKQITTEGHSPDHPDDECTYDSSEFPKGPYTEGGGESDCPQHCSAGERCINAIEISGGRRIGAFLENNLTADGFDYVIAAKEQGGEVVDLWVDFYVIFSA